ncbi:hypothetical protein [Nocardia sp. NPDC050710]|uniref:hypothetical protein n=1 Tax=Nocardia sp. NPDC050710 TaxID=3157220 RepID=UPI0033E579E9
MSAFEETRQTAQELHHFLSATFEWRKRTKAEVTQELTALVLRWSETHPGWQALTESPSVATTEIRSGIRHGRLDVAIDRLASPKLVIEIDSSNKQWSLEKLVAEAMTGAHAIWLRWGFPELRLPVPEPVVLLFFDATKRTWLSRQRSL